jgi:hypothetical protein
VECFANYLQFVYYEVVYLREETARPIFMQLAVFAMPKKQHLEKILAQKFCQVPDLVYRGRGE